MANQLIQLTAIVISIVIFWLFFSLFFKPKKTKAEWVLMCPKCGSIDVKNLFLTGSVLSWNFYLPQKYHCNKCKYEGIMPEVDVTELEDIRKEIKSM